MDIFLDGNNDANDNISEAAMPGITAQGHLGQTDRSACQEDERQEDERQEDGDTVTMPAASAETKSIDKGWNSPEYVTDSIRYREARNQAQSAQKIIAMEFRRAKRLKQKPFQDCPVGEFDLSYYQRQLAESERQKDEMRAKYADRPQMSQCVPLAGLGAGIVAARVEAKMSQADLARRMDTSVTDVQRLEACDYADLPLASLTAVLSALGLDPAVTVHLWNGTPNFSDWPPLT